MKDDDVATPRLDAIENISEMIEGMNIADGYEDISRAGADRLGSEFALHGQVELVHFDVRAAASMVGVPLRNRKHEE